MYNITNIKDLKETIQILEKKQVVQKQLLLEQINLAYEMLNPVSLIKDIFKSLITSLDFKSSILSTVLGLTSGYFTRKFVMGKAGNLLKTFLGNILQYRVANFVSHPPDILKDYLSGLFKSLFSRKAKETKDQ